MTLQCLYRKILHCMKSQVILLENKKTWLYEWIAIIRKRQLYRNVVWTKAQQKEFNDFWKQNYGKRISNRWHKLYQSMNDIFNVGYIPEIIFTTKIEPTINPYFETKALEDKSLIELLCHKKLHENIAVPKTIITSANGILYDGERNIVSLAEAKDILAKVSDYVVKPTVGSSSGHGVRIVNQQSDDTLFEKYQSEYKGNFIIQEKIIPSTELSRLYAGSINTIRITTYVLNSTVHHCPLALRMGTGGANVDNIHAGGISIYVHDDGTLSNTAYRLGYGDRVEKYEFHPDSGVKFADYQLPFIPEVIRTSHSLHGCFPGIGMISWDITVDTHGHIVIIEANMSGQSVWFPQIISGEPLFGNQTACFIKQGKW